MRSIVETAKRVSAVVVGLALLVGGAAGWLIGEDPNPQMAGMVLINEIGAVLGAAVAWLIRRRKDEALQTKHIMYGSVAGACGLWVVLVVIQGGGGLTAALSSGLGGGLFVGAVLAAVWYTVRGPIEESEEPSDTEAIT